MAPSPDRSEKADINFTFNGEPYTGKQGDTLAAALLANDVHLVARSFKYHRPRGILSAGAEEPNALVQLESGAHTEPNIRATQIELYEGLSAKSQNAWPSVNFDLGAINSVFSKIFVAGFYYKTFMHPKSWWMTVFEPAIRRAAGLGRAPKSADPDFYEKKHAHCDVLVVGAGPAGLSAALAAAKTGARVILADELPEIGGSLTASSDEIAGKPATEWAKEALAELTARPEFTYLKRTTVTGYYDHNFLVMAERMPPAKPDAKGTLRQRLWKVRAKQVVLATGAHERPLVFGDNDRPGVMLASAAQAYANRFGVLPGKSVVIFTNNDSAYGAALDLLAAGAEIKAIVDVRIDAKGTLISKAADKGIRIVSGSGVIAAKGYRRVTGAVVAALSEDGSAISGTPETIDCDLIAMSGGWNPAVHLLSQSGGKLRYDETLAGFVPDFAVQATASVGACNGRFALADCLAEGTKAGALAAQSAGFGPADAAPAATISLETTPISPLWLVPGKKPVGHGREKHLVDFQNDVTAADLKLAAREGYQSIEHLKRYTTTGMGTDQGKTSNVNALAIHAATLSAPIPTVGTTTFRPPYTPITYGTLAGRDFGDLLDVIRVTPMHQWHIEHGAKFEDVGQWKRPWFFPLPGETMHDAVNRECLAVRNGVGIIDASTLGKIDIQGPDAAEFLNRVYTNAWSKLAPGRCRYGIMCGEDGMVMDDGVTSCLGENHYLMTTTTGNAAKVMDWLEDYLQCEWPDLKVYLTSVTEQWATASIAGPKARDLLSRLAPDLDLSKEAFPFMSWREAKVGGIDARIFRISFTGEISYEINVPAYHGRALWDLIFLAGVPLGLTPYGTETMHVLRAEKGYVIVGQDSDGTVTPFDLGMDWIVSKKKPDFIGKRSFDRPDTARSDRKHLVGLLTQNPSEVLEEGAQLILEPGGTPPVKMLGHVTSAYYSAVLGKSIALALVADGRNRTGETIHASYLGKTEPCEIVAPVFYDLEGERLNG